VLASPAAVHVILSGYPEEKDTLCAVYAAAVRSAAVDAPRISWNICFVDLSSSPSTEAAESLCDHFIRQGAEVCSEVILSPSLQFLRPKLKITEEEFMLKEASVNFGAPGTHVITGGLGMMGLNFAQWLVNKGATHILLVGRKPPTEDQTLALIESIRKTGVTISTYLTADISTIDGVSAALQQFLFTQQFPSIKTVIHTAGVVNPCLLTAKMTRADVTMLYWLARFKARGCYYS
jgi:hypothetical protein